MIKFARAELLSGRFVSTLDSFVGQERRILCVWSFLPREPVSSRPLRVSTSRKKGRLTEQRAPLSPDWKRIVSLKKIRFPLHSASTLLRLIAPSSRKRPLHSVNCPVFPCLPSPLAILFSFQTLFPNLLVSSNNRGPCSTLKFLRNIGQISRNNTHLFRIYRFIGRIYELEKLAFADNLSQHLVSPMQQLLREYFPTKVLLKPPLGFRWKRGWNK